MLRGDDADLTSIHGRIEIIGRSRSLDPASQTRIVLTFPLSGTSGEVRVPVRKTQCLKRRCQGVTRSASCIRARARGGTACRMRLAPWRSPRAFRCLAEPMKSHSRRRKPFRAPCALPFHALPSGAICTMLQEEACRRRRGWKKRDGCPLL